jgi:hypothetical protein
MLNIKNKIEAWVNANASDKSKTIEIFEVAKEFAKDFALWKEFQVQQDENGNYYGENLMKLNIKYPVNIHSLMDIYLEEKELWNRQINKLK